MNVSAGPRDGAEGLSDQFDLARGKDPRMGRQYLFDERRTRSRQPHDEHRQLAHRSPTAAFGEEPRRAEIDQARHELLLLLRVILAPTLPPDAELQGVRLIEVPGRGRVFAPRIEDLRQAVVQQHLLPIRQAALREQAARRREIVDRQFASQQLSQLEICRSVAGIQPQRRAETFLGPAKLAGLRQAVPKLPCALVKSGQSSRARR